jgi:hypothetical protein
MPKKPTTLAAGRGKPKGPPKYDQEGSEARPKGYSVNTADPRIEKKRTPSIDYRGPGSSPCDISKAERGSA